MGAAAPPNDLNAWLVPDFGKIKDGLDALGPSIQKSIAVLKNLGKSEETGTNEWNTGPFAFWEDIPLCLIWGYCCPCWMSCRNAHQIEPEISCEGHCIQQLIMGCICLGPCYFTAQRSVLRQKYNLKGNDTTDCILACCCGCFLQCQQGRQLGYSDPTYTIPFTGVKGTGAGLPAPAKNMKTDGVAPPVQMMQRPAAPMSAGGAM
eukprot:SM000005S17338  [mRNA]  locus=s5:1530436:1531712:- [translate_table: standard]